MSLHWKASLTGWCGTGGRVVGGQARLLQHHQHHGSQVSTRQDRRAVGGRVLTLRSCLSCMSACPWSSSRRSYASVLPVTATLDVLRSCTDDSQRVSLYASSSSTPSLLTVRHAAEPVLVQVPIPTGR